MTKSQVTTAVSGAIGFLSGVTTALTPVLPFVPARYKDGTMLTLGVVTAVCVGLASFNQSLSGAHTSLPVSEAEALATAAAREAADPLVRKAVARILEAVKR